MVIILIRRCVKPEKVDEFLAKYNRERPKHQDFVIETLTKIESNDDLPDEMKSLKLAEDEALLS